MRQNTKNKANNLTSKRANVALIAVLSFLMCLAASPFVRPQLAASVSSALPMPTPVDETASLTDEQVTGGKAVAKKSTAPTRRQRETIESVVREYLLKNPAIIREAMALLQTQEENLKRETATNNMKAMKTEIFADPDSPVAGNPKGDVSIVVFFDYNCGYCKKTLPGLQVLLAKDPSIRIVYKEFPILGPQSQTAAQAAMAASRQGKYVEFHNALIVAESAGDDVIKGISDKLGLDYAKLQKDMKDTKINEALERNLNLATALDINGTPAYIVGDQIIPGAIDASSLANIVAAERAKLTKNKTVITPASSKK